MNVTLDLAGLVNILVSIILPVLVGLVTKSSTASGIKAVILLLLTTISAYLTQAIAYGVDHFAWASAGLAAVLSFVTAVASHYGLLKPTGITPAAQRSGPVKDPVS